MGNRYLVGKLLIALVLLLAACQAEPDPPGSTQTPSSTSTRPEATTDEAESAADDDISMTTQPTAQPASTPEAEEISPTAERSFAGTVPAPEFPVGLDWLNIDMPLRMADLRGKIVLLDFWTYGCINCMHIIPDLKKLEEKYADELVVIGVHSAKFENESETENIRQIILRYDREHPVVNDKNFQVWSLYGARAWPTLVLIDPDGNILGYHSGEGIYEPFDAVISGMIAEFDADGRIDRTPLVLKLEKDSLVDSPLLFPGKVLADEDGERLFIADSNHNRLVISDTEGNVLEVIGDGQPRLKDGDFESASFNRPQGMALAEGRTLYVADTENHAIREVNLDERTVSTVAGTGQQEYMRFPATDAVKTPLNSPWDVLYHDGLLYIAMAGQHQIWAYDPAEGLIFLYAGTGREELKDGQLAESGLNQPSGLATDGQLLYIADSEASAIRSAELSPGDQMSTVVGVGLFDFGDVDGIGDEVRLQHPLGVVFYEDRLFVADTYNSKIKMIDPEERESATFLGGSEAGWRDGYDVLFNEPGGLSIADDKIYIADTNNHVIRVADINSREVQTLVLIDMQGLLTRQAPDEEYSGKEVMLNPQTVGEGEGMILLDIVIPEGYKVNDLAPFSMEWAFSSETASIGLGSMEQRIVNPTFPLTISVELNVGAGQLTGDLVIYYCEEDAESLCLIERVRITAPLTVEKDGSQHEIVIFYEIPEPDYTISG